jgi:hypothetical protein
LDEGEAAQRTALGGKERAGWMSCMLDVRERDVERESLLDVACLCVISEVRGAPFRASRDRDPYTTVTRIEPESPNSQRCASL